MIPDIEIELDLRDLSRRIDGLAAIETLWSAIEPSLVGLVLTAGSSLTVDRPEGTVNVSVRRNRDGSSVSTSTVFAVVGLRRRADLVYKCAQCPQEDPRYGPFSCVTCRTVGDKAETRLCDEHVTILDGALLPTCAEHVPMCAECGQTATFRCAGRSCQSRTAHCTAHGRSHPAEPSIRYCPSCYSETFPTCEAQNCGRVAKVRCERVDEGGHACDARACPRHARRWMVYGPARRVQERQQERQQLGGDQGRGARGAGGQQGPRARQGRLGGRWRPQFGVGVGIGLCNRHSNVTGIEPIEIIRQIATTSATRSPEERLPSVAAIMHTARKSGWDRVAPDEVLVAARTLIDSRRVSDSVAGAMKGRSKGWQEEVERINQQIGSAVEMLDRIRAHLVVSLPIDGTAIAASLTLDGARPFVKGRRRDDGTVGPDLLFVDLPQQFRPAFIGRGGSMINALSSLVGAKINLKDGKRR